MFRFLKTQPKSDDNLLSSRLYDQDSFYGAFKDDLKKAKSQVVIESPFISAKRMTVLLPVFRTRTRRGVQLVINRKPPHEHEPEYRVQAEQAVARLLGLGVIVLFTGGHHRKLVIIDRSVPLPF